MIGKKLFSIMLSFIILAAFLSAGCTWVKETEVKKNTENGKNEHHESATLTIADATGDWGFPAPYTHYLRGPGYIRMSLIFDTLIWKDKNGFTGALATDWQYLEDENAYLFNLRQDVRWHDDTPFTAEDVLFTFQYYQEHPYPWSDTSIIKNVTAPDNYTVKIYLQKPYAPFLANIAGTVPILPEHIYKDVANPENWQDPRAATGSGPFKLVDYNQEHGTYLYAANEDYYLGKPRVDQIRFIKVNEQMTPAALLNGSASAGAVPPEVVNSLKDQGFTVLASGHDWNAKLVFNHTQEPFANTKFRQAIAYAIDREKLVQIAQRGHALVGSPGLLPSDNPWYTPEIDNYNYNPEKSLELFKELGYHLQDGLLQKNGQPLTLELLFTSSFSRDAELIKLDLEKVGIQVTVQSLEAKTVDAKIKDWDFQMAISGHGGLGGDPEIFNRVVLGDGFNSARYHANESLTEMIFTQMTLMDREERRQMVAAIQKLYAQELPTLTLYYPDNYWAHNGEVDLYYTPQGIGSGVPLPLNKLSFVK